MLYLLAVSEVWIGCLINVRSSYPILWWLFFLGLVVCFWLLWPFIVLQNEDAFVSFNCYWFPICLIPYINGRLSHYAIWDLFILKHLFQRDTTGLTTENTELKLRLQAREQQAKLCDGKSQTCKETIQISMSLFPRYLLHMFNFDICYTDAKHFCWFLVNLWSIQPHKMGWLLSWYKNFQTGPKLVTKRQSKRVAIIFCHYLKKKLNSIENIILAAQCQVTRVYMRSIDEFLLSTYLASCYYFFNYKNYYDHLC